MQFGDDTNVNRFQLEVNALVTANVAMFQLDRASKDVLDATSTPGSQPALGASAADTYLGAGMTSGLVVIGKTVTTGSSEMSALCQGLYDEGEWFVTGEGEVAANQYGSVLKPRGPVTIKGIGETYSGVYYVTHVNSRLHRGRLHPALSSEAQCPDADRRGELSPRMQVGCSVVWSERLTHEPGTHRGGSGGEDRAPFLRQVPGDRGGQRGSRRNSAG